MSEPNDSKKLRSVTIDLGETQAKIESILAAQGGPAKIRLSCWGQERSHVQAVELTEGELVDFLQKAIRSGVLSLDFIKDLSSEFEI